MVNKHVRLLFASVSKVRPREVRKVGLANAQCRCLAAAISLH